MDVNLIILDVARLRARARRLGWHANWSSINVSFRATVNSDVPGSSAAIPFALSTGLVEPAGLDELSLPGLHLESEQVRVASFVIIAGFEILLVFFNRNISEILKRSTRAIRDKL